MHLVECAGGPCALRVYGDLSWLLYGGNSEADEWKSLFLLDDAFVKVMLYQPRADGLLTIDDNI